MTVQPRATIQPRAPDPPHPYPHGACRSPRPAPGPARPVPPFWRSRPV